MAMYRILLLDDEPYVLSALRRELLQKPDIGHDGLEVEAFSSPEEALQRANEPDGYFDLVISDYQMPGMNGVAFLKAFSNIHPYAVRLILSGISDMKDLAVAIDEAYIDFFIPKPWTEYELKRVLVQALKRYEARRENRRLVKMLPHGAGFKHGLEHKSLYHVMAVDDDPFILKTLQRELGEPFTKSCNGLYKLEVHTFNTAKDALSAAHNTQFDMVISDYAMPFANGIEFLRLFREIQPDTVRILISGKADLTILAEALNTAGISFFISKPWHDYELRLVIVRALSHRELELENRILADLAQLRVKH